MTQVESALRENYFLIGVICVIQHSLPKNNFLSMPNLFVSHITLHECNLFFKISGFFQIRNLIQYIREGGRWWWTQCELIPGNDSAGKSTGNLATMNKSIVALLLKVGAPAMMLIFLYIQDKFHKKILDSRTFCLIQR